MQTLMQAAGPITITGGATALLFVIDPLIFYSSLTVAIFTCLMVCVQIIRNCHKRNKRIDALYTRATRRVHANASSGKCGDNKAP